MSVALQEDVEGTDAAVYAFDALVKVGEHVQDLFGYGIISLCLNSCGRRGGS
jgi:hypothetical protein